MRTGALRSQEILKILWSIDVQSKGWIFADIDSEFSSLGFLQVKAERRRSIGEVKAFLCWQRHDVGALVFAIRYDRKLITVEHSGKISRERKVAVGNGYVLNAAEAQQFKSIVYHCIQAAARVPDYGTLEINREVMDFRVGGDEQGRHTACCKDYTSGPLHDEVPALFGIQDRGKP